jgi:ubiquinone/menaquinone biosynthesis C-methylase UbiE
VGTNTEWLFWGRHDPLWGAVTYDFHARGDALAWTDEAFYELGRADWQRFRPRWEAYGMGTASCLDLGCGPGRITRQMAEVFDEVHAVDVSPDMLAYARQRIPAPNVRFHLTDGRHLPVGPDTVAAVFSAHVFQHFERVRQAEGYFHEIFRVLQPGGSLMIHLPLYEFPGGSPRAAAILRTLYGARQTLKRAHALYKRTQIRAGRSVRFMTGISYETRWTSDTLRRIGFTDVEFTTFVSNADGSFQSFVFARKHAPDGSTDAAGSGAARRLK